jgi:hypothetical protein
MLRNPKQLANASVTEGGAGPPSLHIHDSQLTSFLNPALEYSAP